MNLAIGAGIAPTSIDIICSDCECNIMSYPPFSLSFGFPIPISINMQKNLGMWRIIIVASLYLAGK